MAKLIIKCRYLKANNPKHSENLIHYISKRDSVEKTDDSCKSLPETKSQKKLNAAERMRNLKDAFQITESVRGLRILIVDDVYTTGSTIETLAECLKESGAGEIYFVTLCIGQL